MAKYWWERRGGQWWDFDTDPKHSYYKFLRAVYHMEAAEAWKHTKAAFIILFEVGTCNTKANLGR